jgi:predicted nucleotidyltransferase
MFRGLTMRRQVNALKLDEVVMPNRDRILQTAAQHGAHRIRVFGSVARRQDDANSDIDFLVEMEPGRSLFDLGGLLMDLEQLLNTKVDVVTERGLKERIRERVLNEAIPL